MWVCPGASPPAIFKADRIWRENDESPFGKRWTERLQRISDEPTDLALPEVALAVMLMVHKDGRRGFAKPLRHQQECRNRVTVGSFVGDATSLEQGFDIDGNDFNLDPGCGRPEPEPVAEVSSKAGGVVHDPILARSRRAAMR
jgi:hypothetical protein